MAQDTVSDAQTGTASRKLPALTLSCRDRDDQGEHLSLPSPLAALRQAWPVVLEAMVGPLALFYLVLVTVGFRGALIAALVWSCVALGRRIQTWRARLHSSIARHRPFDNSHNGVLRHGQRFLVFRATNSWHGGDLSCPRGFGGSSTAVYTAVRTRFLPDRPGTSSRPCIRRFFIRISLLWATVLMLNAGIVFWLLLSSSLRAFVLERTAVTWSLTIAAIFLSVTRFVAAMRRDGVTVEWGRSRKPQALIVG